MRGLLLVPALIAGVIVLSWFLNRERPPVQEAAMITKEPSESWSGYWGEKTTSALLRLRQAGVSLSGDYAPSGDRAALCRFKGAVEGDTARFDVKIRGQLWHCTLERDGNTTMLRGRKDMDALLDAYGKDDRLPNGAVIIAPRNADRRREDAARLQRKREEIRKAAAPVLLGTFERIEVQR